MIKLWCSNINNKMNHTVNTLRRGTLTIYHKSASGEKQNSSAVRCKIEKDRKRETVTEQQTWGFTPWHRWSLISDLTFPLKNFSGDVTSLSAGFICVCNLYSGGWQLGCVLPRTPPWSRSLRRISSGWCAAAGRPLGWPGAADLSDRATLPALTPAAYSGTGPDYWFHWS